jgi:hypothetical protein
MALVAAACGNSNPITVPGAGGNGANGANGGNGGAVVSGLEANLDKLDSYQFSWQLSTSSTTGTSADSGSLATSGIVVNKPTPAYKVNNLGMMQIIVVGTQGWTSFDGGTSWMTSTDYSSDSSSLKSLLPSSLYGQDFGGGTSNFSAKGDETKNGVACVHYSGSNDLGAAGALAGVAGTFKADLWVAKDGNYPVSGFYGFSGAANGEAGGYGYTFDITHVNDAAANVIAAPTNVTTIPGMATDTPSN